MTIDLSKIRTGDVVGVGLVVCRTQVGECFEVRVPHANGDNAVNVLASAIVSHTPKALSVGDRVKWETGPDVEVLAMHDGSAWVVSAGGSLWTAPIGQLERIP